MGNPHLLYYLARIPQLPPVICSLGEKI